VHELWVDGKNQRHSGGHNDTENPSLANNMLKITKFFIVSLVLFCAAAYSAQIKLKSGDSISGIIISKDDQALTIDYKGTSIKFYNFEIESIDGKPILEQPKKEGAQKDAEALVKIPVVAADDYFKRGVIFYSKNDYELAVATLSHAIKINPKHTESYFNRALSYVAMRKYDEALSDCNQAIGLNPKYAQAYFLRGLIQSNKNNFDAAIAEYSKAIDSDPEYIQPYLNRAMLYINADKLEEAIEDVNKVIKINPRIAAAYYISGVIFTKRGNIEEALNSYAKAIEVQPAYVEAYLNRALVYAYKSGYSGEKPDTTSPRFYINLGQLQIKKEDSDKALADCNKAIELSPKDSQPYLVRARIYYMIYQFDRALEDVRKAEELGGKPDPQFIEFLKKESEKEK
jgi:tetratricopeptide (TPR) repeat protein